VKDQVGLIVFPERKSKDPHENYLKLPQLDRELSAADDVLTLTGKPE